MRPTVPDIDRKYDVAISFKWRDVETARELYELLCDRMEVFFADERFTEFVATDGEETFARIFGEQARVVVILYRPEWGKSGFTMHEHTAISNRAFNETYGFTVWVPLGEGTELPASIPKSYVHVDLNAYGLPGLAAVVNEAVRKMGQTVRPPSVLDELSIEKRKRDQRNRRHSFLSSVEAAHYAQDSMAAIPQIAADHAARIAERDELLGFRIDESAPGQTIRMRLPRITLQLKYGPQYIYSGSRSGFAIKVKTWMEDDYETPKAGDVKEIKYEIDMNADGQPGWQSGKEHLTTEQVVMRAMESAALKYSRWVNRD